MPVILAVAIAIAAAASLFWYVRRRSRTPPELHDNWWPEFERAYRAYVRQTTARSHTKE